MDEQVTQWRSQPPTPGTNQAILKASMSFESSILTATDVHIVRMLKTVIWSALKLFGTHYNWRAMTSQPLSWSPYAAKAVS